MKPSQRARTKLGKILVVISLLLAIPSAISSVLNLHVLAVDAKGITWFAKLSEPIGWICLAASLVLLVLAFILAAPALLSLIVKPFVMLRWAHLDQVGAAAEVPRYIREMRYHSRLLGIRPKDLSRTSRLPYLISWFFLQHPEIIPRPELCPLFLRALLLPERAFRHKQPYGEELTVARLRWYFRKNIAYVDLLCKVDKMNNRARAQVLSRVEQQIAKDIGLVEQ
jgi:hypothetical protein